MTTNNIPDTLHSILGDVTINGTALPTYTVSPSTWSATGTSVNWSPNTWTTTDTFTIGSIAPAAHIGNSGKISLQGKEADIEINGESLVKMLKRIEERINILTVNAELEAEWDELRELGEQYRALEQRIKDKMETWKKLSAQDKENR